MRTKTKSLVISAMLAALICAATMIIKIPSPIGGYINLGDGIVLLAAWMLSPLYGFLAAGIGSALADLLSGYAVYAPATFLIKGLMAVLAYFICKHLSAESKRGNFTARLTGGIVAETLMVVGYYVFEGILYGFAPSLANIPANVVQGCAGIIVGIILVTVIPKERFL